MSKFTLHWLPQIFVDLDGTLADFDQGHYNAFGFRPDKEKDDVDWNKVRKVKGFYEDLPPMPDMDQLWDFVAPLWPAPVILTGIPSNISEAADNKIAWVRKHLGGGVEVRCCRSRDKSLHCKPGDVLIDDWEKHKQKWLDAGGRWVTHTSAANSIKQLQQMGIGL